MEVRGQDVDLTAGDGGRWISTALLAAYAAGMCLLAVGSYFLVSFYRDLPDLRPLWALASLPLAFWLALVLYSGKHGIPGRKAFLWVGGLAGLAAVACYPFGSRDVFLYIETARVTAEYGLEPYAFTVGQVFANHPADSILRLLANEMMTAGFTYGYVFYGYLRALWSVTMGSPYVMLYVHKAIMLVAAVAAGLLTDRLDRSLAAGSGREPLGLRWWLLAVTLNPLVLLEGVANGHNDLLLVVLLLAVLLLLVREHTGWAVLVLAVALHVKLSVVLLAPLFLVWALREGVRPRWKVPVYLGGILASFLPYWFFLGVKGVPPGLVFYAEQANQGALLWQILMVVPPGAARDVLGAAFCCLTPFWWAGLTVLAALYAWKGKPGIPSLMAWSAGGYLLYLGVLSGYVWPWYYLWPLPFLVLLSQERQRSWAAVLVATYLLQLAIYARWR